MECNGDRLLSTGEVPKRLGCPRWRVLYVFDAGYLPEPSRIGGKRVVRESDIPAIRDALARLEGRR